MPKSPASKHVERILRACLPRTADVVAMASALHVTTQVVYNWRSGKRALRNPQTIVDVARYFKMTTDQLLGVSPDPVSAQPQITGHLVEIARRVLSAAERAAAVAEIAQEVAEALQSVKDVAVQTTTTTATMNGDTSARPSNRRRRETA